MQQTEARRPGLSRRDLLKGGLALAVLAGCGIRTDSVDSAGPSRRDLERTLADNREDHRKMEAKIGDIDRLMDNLENAAREVLGNDDHPLLSPFTVHKINRDTNPDRNSYTRRVRNAEHLLDGRPHDQLVPPSLNPAHYTYGFLERGQDVRSAAYTFGTRSVDIGDMDPTNLLDGLTFYHETDHALHNGLWIAKAQREGENALSEYTEFAASNPSPVILEMEVDASLDEINMLNVITKGRYLEAVKRGDVRFKDFQKELGARPNQAEDFEGLARNLASKADIENGGFVNTPAFSRAIEERYEKLGLGVVKSQKDFSSAPDFLAA